MSLYRAASHDTHDDQWLFSTSPNRDAVCFACLVEVLETDGILVVQKQPAMSELSCLLQNVELVHQLQCSPHISSHVLMVLIEIMKSEDETFASNAMEVCMKMLLKLGSEEQVCAVVDLVQSHCECCQDHKKLLPLYLLLGRMIKTLPGLIHVMSGGQGTLLHHLSGALSYPNEDVQSAVVYVFVHIHDDQWREMLPQGVQHQVLQEAVHLLASAKSQGLTRNVLALVNKMVSSEDITNMLMTITVENTSLISALKKHLVSKNGIQQKSAIQILSNILKHRQGTHAATILKSDVIEFLFEALMTDNSEQIEYVLQCLSPLCHMELFYTKCHSVYGLESLLRVLNILMDTNNPDLTEKAMIILGIILKCQPDCVPLFVSSKTVQSCLEVITRGIQDFRDQIFCPAVTAFHGVLRKNHLLLPVPFEELKKMLSILSKEIWHHTGSVSGPSRSARHVDVVDNIPRPAEGFLHVCLSCISLLEQCSEDPAACLSSFTGTTTKQGQSSDQNFKDFFITVCVNSAVSYSVKALDEEGDPDLCGLILSLLCHLYDLDIETTSRVIVRLASAGFIIKVMELKSSISSSRDSPVQYEHTVDKFLTLACSVLHKNDNPDVALPDWIETGIPKAKFRFEDFPQILSKLDEVDDTFQFYLFLLYHIYRLDQMPIPVSRLEEFLITSSSLLTRKPQLSPFVIKYYIFLWAFASCLSEDKRDDSATVVEFISTATSGIEPHSWYTHHPALLYWSCKDIKICKIFGSKILELWIGAVSEKWGDTDIVNMLPDNPDFQPIYEMFTTLDFLDIFMTLFVTSNDRVLRIATQILHHVVCEMRGSDFEDSFLRVLNKQLKECLQEAFLHYSSQQTADTRISSFLSVLLVSYKEDVYVLDTDDIKVLHHVIKWISQDVKRAVGVVQPCLEMVLVYCQNTNNGNTVKQLIIQNEDAIGSLESLSQHGDTRVRVVITKILTQLINYQIREVGVSKSHSRRITVDLQPIEDRLCNNNLLELEAFLQLLAALFHSKFCCHFVNLQNTGRLAEDMMCPLTIADFTLLFCYLQQHTLQDVSSVRVAAINCLTGLISYLKSTNPCIADELLAHPWNKPLMEVMIQTTDSTSIGATIQFFHMFLESESGKKILTGSSSIARNLCELLNTLQPSLKDQESYSNEIEALISSLPQSRNTTA